MAAAAKFATLLGLSVPFDRGFGAQLSATTASTSARSETSAALELGQLIQLVNALPTRPQIQRCFEVDLLGILRDASQQIRAVGCHHETLTLLVGLLDGLTLESPMAVLKLASRVMIESFSEFVTAREDGRLVNSWSGGALISAFVLASQRYCSQTFRECVARCAAVLTIAVRCPRTSRSPHRCP